MRRTLQIPPLTRVLVDQAVLGHERTDLILNNLREGGLEFEPQTISGKSSVQQIISDLKTNSDSFGLGKTVAYLTKGQGKLLHHCPGTQKAFCCNLFVIDLVENCPYDCSYCYLQNHLTSPLLRINVNVDDFLRDLDAALKQHPNKVYRIGTGELGDSLALDSITEHSKDLVEFAAKHDNVQLELKTKSDQIDNLLSLDSRGHTVVGWSINPRVISEKEEHMTASIDARLAAAEKVSQAGYPVAFHFDPLIRFLGWNHHYLELVNEIFDRFTPESIAWISLGTLRFPKGLRQTAMERFPASKLPLGEFIRGVDNKERYEVSERCDVYERMLLWIRRRFPKVPTYMCMENPAVWGKIFGGKPRTDSRLSGIYG